MCSFCSLAHTFSFILWWTIRTELFSPPTTRAVTLTSSLPKTHQRHAHSGPRGCCFWGLFSRAKIEPQSNFVLCFVSPGADAREEASSSLMDTFHNTLTLICRVKGSMATKDPLRCNMQMILQLLHFVEKSYGNLLLCGVCVCLTVIKSLRFIFSCPTCPPLLLVEKWLRSNNWMTLPFGCHFYDHR